MKRFWSSKEDEQLKKFYIAKGANFCASKLNRSRHAIYQRAGQFDLKIPNEIFQQRSRMTRLSKGPVNCRSAWRRRVLFFGNYSCIDCKLFDPGIVIAHHIDSNKDRFAISNGIVLCPNCHSKRHWVQSLIKNKKLTKEQIQMISDLWLKGMGQEKICNLLRISRQTVKKYLNSIL